MRILLKALAIGFSIEFLLWALYYTAVSNGPDAIAGFIWLDRLQRPAIAVGLPIWRYAAINFGHAHFWTWMASIAGFSSLVAAWSLAAFLSLKTIQWLKQSRSS